MTFRGVGEALHETKRQPPSQSDASPGMHDLLSSLVIASRQDDGERVLHPAVPSHTLTAHRVREEQGPQELASTAPTKAAVDSWSIPTCAR